MTHKPGEDLDELVLVVMRRRPSLGEALCVPIGPMGHPVDWVVAAPAAGPMHQGGEVRRVFVHRCECSSSVYAEVVDSTPASEFILGHDPKCLRPVPRYSLEEVASLPLLRRFKNVDIAKSTVGSGKEKWVFTSYDKGSGVFVEGESLPHVLALAVAAVSQQKCST